MSLVRIHHKEVFINDELIGKINKSDNFEFVEDSDTNELSIAELKDLIKRMESKRLWCDYCKMHKDNVKYLREDEGYGDVCDQICKECVIKYHAKKIDIDEINIDESEIAVWDNTDSDWNTIKGGKSC